MVNAEVVRVRVRSVELAGARSALASMLATTAARTSRFVRSAWCTLNGGHYRVLHAEPERLALRCVSCGDVTPGWEIRAARHAPTPTRR